MTSPFVTDPNLDLVIERVIEVPRRLVWEAWTKPEHLKAWYIPRPWSLSECELDVRPGGLYRTVARSPEGMEFPSLGCFLEIVPMERLVFTTSLLPGWRPAPSGGMPMPFTAIITMESEGDSTRYVATTLHPSEESRKRPEAMGMHYGWKKALDQLIEHAKSSMMT
jgi:uncharacterized protein YndB with AHSA1/START domain